MKRTPSTKDRSVRVCSEFDQASLINIPMKKQCPEYVPKRDHFRTFILSGIHHCPGFLKTITLLDSLWTFSGHFLDIFGTYVFFRTFSGHFQARIYLTRARIYQLTQARIKNLYLMVKFIYNAINI